MEDDKLSPTWQKIQILSGLAASILVPLTIGIAGYRINQSIQASDIGPGYVELAVDILKEPPSPDTENLRKWAVEIVDSYAQIPLSEAARSELEHEVLTENERIDVEFVASFEGNGLVKNGKVYPYKTGQGNEIIGYGHLVSPEEQQTGTITIDGEAVPYKDGITADQSKALLEQDLEPVRRDVRNLVTVEVTQNQLNALTSFAYNIGLSAFEKSTLLKQLNAGNHHKVPGELRKFTQGNNGVLPGLVTRREAEIELWNRPDAAPQQ